MARAELASDWTCVRCGVTASWMTGPERRELPPNWSHEDGEVHCLACRRDRAAEAALNAPAENSSRSPAQLRSSALVDFELGRDPDRPNGEIARAAHSSVMAVAKARQRLGSPSQD